MTADHRGDYRYLFNLTNRLLFRKEPSPLPIHDSKQQLADDFNDFCDTKIKLIMEKLKPTGPGDTNNDLIKHDYLTNLRFHDFREVTPEEVKTTVKKAPSKSCKSDPIPTTLLKDHLDT